MPLGVLEENGRPLRLGLIAQAGQEDHMLHFMSAFESLLPKRVIPHRLLTLAILHHKEE